MFIAAQFPSSGIRLDTHQPIEWIKKMWYTYTREYYSAIKKNEIMSFARKWVKLEIITLSEISQTEKVKYCMFSFVCVI
jgi:hypothetical protein